MDVLSEWMIVVVALLDVVAIVHVWMQHIETGRKVVWSLVIVLLPVVGLLMWGMAASRVSRVRL